jgi:hypothetical protein
LELADARSALRFLDGVASLVAAATFYRQHYQPGDGETLGLTWADLDIEGEIIDMSGEHSKGRARRLIDDVPER